MSATDWLSAPIVPLAWCWRLERCDGAVLGLTTHDAPLAIGGLPYSPAPGIRPSAIRQRRGFGSDTMEVEGALSSSAIDATELAQGRWDGARLTLIAADWQDADARHVIIASGRLGEVSSDGTAFTADLDGRDPRLIRRAAPQSSIECRADLGDGDCRVALARHTRRASVIALDRTTRRVTLSGSWAADSLIFGTIRWCEGAARGLSATIIGQEGAVVTLATLPVADGLIGARVEVVEGCDKRAATCAARFANIINFRGEPHLPGIDLLTRFPGA